MASPFAFLPRKIALSKTTISKVNNPSGPQAIAPSSPQPSTSSKGKEKETTRAPHSPDEDDVVLVWLSLSDYALWSDGDLRMRMERNPDEEDGGYISFNYLASHAPILSSLKRSIGTSQTPLMKAIRSHAPHIFDIQLIISEPQSWFSRSGSAALTSASGPSGYKIRRKGWSEASNLGYTKDDWVQRTIYVEHVPVECRSITALVGFLLSVLPQCENATNSDAPSLKDIRRIQNVTLPPHHYDKTGTTPTFKGFALVTCLDIRDAQYLLRLCPWDQAEGHCSPPPQLSMEGLAALHKAKKFGFRTLSKSHWEALRAEYVSYRQGLIVEINQHQEDTTNPTPPPTTLIHPETNPAEEKSTIVQTLAPTPDGSAEPSITLRSPFPYGCLVFVKNLHPETNKTTLKTLFSRILASKLSNPGAEAGLDYVDFNKGMDSCHLRLGTPTHAENLATHFTANPTIQCTGLDDQGSSLPKGKMSSSKPIDVEIVRGTREELYWKKVPEKIRRGAVEKALRLLPGEGGTLDQVEGVDDPRPNKRRRRR